MPESAGYLGGMLDKCLVCGNALYQTRTRHSSCPEANRMDLQP
jgi:hypothetical protein